LLFHFFNFLFSSAWWSKLDTRQFLERMLNSVLNSRRHQVEKVLTWNQDVKQPTSSFSVYECST